MDSNSTNGPNHAPQGQVRDMTVPANLARALATEAAREMAGFVLPACRGHGLGRRLLEAIEHRARELGCCRLTLEVQEHNHRARAIYGAAGFAQAVYVAEDGGSLYMAKQL